MDGILAIIAGAVSGVWGLVSGLFSPAPAPEDFVQFTAQPVIEEPAPRNIQPGAADDATPENKAYVEDKKAKNLVDLTTTATPKEKDDGDGDAVTVLRE